MCFENKKGNVVYLESGFDKEKIDLQSFESLWRLLEKRRGELDLTLVKGSLSDVVNEQDVFKLKQCIPSTEIIQVENANHAVQSDQPVKLAEILNQILNKR